MSVSVAVVNGLAVSNGEISVMLFGAVRPARANACVYHSGLPMLITESYRAITVLLAALVTAIAPMGDRSKSAAADLPALCSAVSLP